MKKLLGLVMAALFSLSAAAYACDGHKNAKAEKAEKAEKADKVAKKDAPKKEEKPKS